MTYRLHYLSLLTATLFGFFSPGLYPIPTPLGIKAVSAQETTVSQCDQIITVANETLRNAKTITNDGETSDSEAILKAAEYMDYGAEQMESLSISDSTLQGFQSQFILMYRQTSQAIRDFAQAFEAGNRAEAELALERLQAATTPEKQLVEDINNYCGRESVEG